MASVHVDLDFDGLFSSSDIRDAVEDKANEIAERVRDLGIMVEGDPGTVPLPVNVYPEHTLKYARVYVVTSHPAGIAVEAKYRALGGALG